MWKKTFILLLMVLVCSLSVNAQTILTPKTVALGGGGVAYITDYNANFINPANLFISDRVRNFDMGLLITGTYFNGVQNFSNLKQQRSNFEDYMFAFKPGSYSISELDRQEILEDNYIRNRSTSLHQSRLDITLLGIKIRNSKRALSFVIRNRISSSFEVGKGWYSSTLQTKDNTTFLDRSLTHRYQSLYEFSFGYAESFEFFTNMSSSLDEFIIGFAPKFVLAGSNINARWKNEFIQLQNGDIQQIHDFNYQDSGNFTDATSSYLSGMPAQIALAQNITDHFFDPQSIGAGLDIGFTYLLTLGSDFLTLDKLGGQTQKSLRLSFSITDVGFVHYDKTSHLIINSDTTNSSTLPINVPTDAFVGAPGQFLDFIDQFSMNNPLKSASSGKKINTILLPTTLHAGLFLELKRLKLMGDLSVGLTNNAFNSSKLVASAGVELRLLHFLPLRAGTQLATELPDYFSFGAAMETKVWDVSIATQFVSNTLSESPTLSGVTVAALQFHF